MPSDATIRLGCFVGVLVTMSAWELAAPRRPWMVRKAPRWFGHLSLAALNSLLVRLILPLSAWGMATIAAERGWGLLNLWPAPGAVRFIIALGALDLAIYIQHVLFHAVPAFWRLHMVHHADLDFDVTTGLRFHTIEILLSALIKHGVVLALGPSASAVLTFEVLLNGTSMFNHSNVRIPVRLDRALRLIVVTPDMHRVHHSVDRGEANTNFGFNLPWWDFLLGTYRAQPAAGHTEMQIGVSDLRDERTVERLPGMLALPFLKKSRGDSMVGRNQP